MMLAHRSHQREMARFYRAIPRSGFVRRFTIFFAADIEFYYMTLIISDTGAT
jgi:hypothetical protein